MTNRVDIQDISAGYRSIVNGRQYNRFFAIPDSEDRIILDDGDVNDTVELMKKVVWRYIDDTKLIARELQATSQRASCENIWNFLFNHIQYRLDKKGVEQLRRPVRSWAEREQGIDCDCFSIFVSSILTNLQIPHKFRITKYGDSDVFQHVYVIVPQANKDITIDCVLNKFDYEKPYSQKKDFTMNMNGINVAVLSGIDGDVLDLVSGLEGFGDTRSPENDQLIYEHLIKTRTMIAANPSLINTVDYPPAFLKMLDYAIDNWNTPNREKALAILAKNEEELNKRNGFSGFDDDDLDGLDEIYDEYDELNGKKAPKKAGKKGFFKKVGEAAKKGAKMAIKSAIRFNPLTITARNGFLLAVKINLKKMGSKLKWAYATKEQAAAKGVSVSDWEKSKKALTKIEKLFVDKLQGKKSALKNAVLKGKAGGLNGIDEETSVDGLGVAPAAAIAAAIPVITSALKALVDSGAMKKAEAEGLEAEIKAKTNEANTSASESDMSSNESGTDAGSKSSGDGGADDKSSGGIIGFVKKQPILVIGGAALGIWGLTKLLGGKKSNGNAMGKVSQKRKKNKKKASPKVKTKELQ